MLTDVYQALAGKILAAVGPAVPGEIEVQVAHVRNFNPTPPSIDIFLGDPSRDTDTAAFNEIGGEMNFVVRARVTSADTTAGQELIYRFLDDEDPICVAAILMEDQTLNGLAGSVYIDGFSGLGLHDGADDSGPLVGVTWHGKLFRVIT